MTLSLFDEDYCRSASCTLNIRYLRFYYKRNLINTICSKPKVLNVSNEIVIKMTDHGILSIYLIVLNVFVHLYVVWRVWRYQRGNQNSYIEEQTTQWPKEKKVQKDKQRSTKHAHETKDRVTQTPLKTGVNYVPRKGKQFQLH